MVNSPPNSERIAIRSHCDKEDQATYLIQMVFERIIDGDLSDLTMRQMAIFMNVAESESVSMTDIMSELSLPKSNVSRSVDVLEAKGIVKRKREGKFVKIAMTPQGRAAIGRVISSLSVNL